MIGFILGLGVFGSMFYALMRIAHWIEHHTNR